MEEIDLISRNKIFILGAGASMDYGLPSWVQLKDLLIETIKKDNEDKIRYKEEITNWINKVGKDYSTVDESIYFESVSEKYHIEGPNIEQEIFSIIKNILKDNYKPNNNGWIRFLNDFFKENVDLNLQNRIYFVNYNYDAVIEKNILNYNYIPVKHQRWNYKNILKKLSETRLFSFYPHGYLEISNSNYIYKYKSTNKTNIEDIDAVTCFDSRKYRLVDNNYFYDHDLFILGLGGGLETNLNNIDFKIKIKNIYITIKDGYRKDEIIIYLENKFSLKKENIYIYDNCVDLIKGVFNEKYKN